VLLYFFRRYIFIVCCDPSNMSKRILQSTGLVAIELIPHWLAVLAPAATACLATSSTSLT
jgi:hypothetical protein